MFGLYEDLVQEYSLMVKRHFKDKLWSICVFGSVARGEATPESDVDVLVVAEGLPFDAGMRTKETNYIHMELKKTEAYRRLRALGSVCLISDVFFTPDEIRRHPTILLDIIEDGVILYDRNSFLEDEISILRNSLAKMGARRRVTKRGRFWILKPDIKPGEVIEL